MALTVRQRSIHNKNGSKKSTSFNKGKKNAKGNGGEYLVSSAPTDFRGISYPGGAVALMLLLSARLLSAYYGQISDCDETYNYWEPLHFLVYGSGLQTWEYSPAYAIRSYAPLWLIAAPAKILSLFLDAVTVFYSVRTMLAVFTAISEFMFYKAVCHEFGVHVGRMWLFLCLPSAGQFGSAAALLPSAWGHALGSAALACWWRRRYPAAIMLTAANALLSWPFTALLGAPIAIDMILYKKRYLQFFKWSIISFVLISAPMVILDSWHYGNIVVAPWNIISYNIFTKHGPNLYGVEPWTYYFVNGFLNFNVVWVLALSTPLLLAACWCVAPKSVERASFCAPYWLDLSPLALWLAVFMLQPHKEERFLHPVYSMIVLAGAISLDCLQKFTFAIGSAVYRWGKERERRHYLEYTGPVMVLYILVAGLLGISRITALYVNYHAPMDILSQLPSDPIGEANVCFGKEWYRSPSSFHLPGGYRIRFVESDFAGQMPAPYYEGDNATRILHPYFNDQNKGDSQTYFSPEECEYLVDSDLGEPTTKQPDYHTHPDWEVVRILPILDAESSHRLFRAFYVPVWSQQYTRFGHFYLLKNKHLNG